MTKNPTRPDTGHGRTLADILDGVARHPDLSAGRRRDLCSAVRTTARLIGKLPEAIEADWPALRRRFAAMAPATHGISAKRLQNVRTDLRAALKASGGLSARPYRERAPTWEALYRSLPSKLFKNGLSGFIRFCSDHDIDPRAVSDETFGQYREYLETEGARAKPQDVHRRGCRLWNQAVAEVDGWPQQSVTVPDHRRDPWQVPWENLTVALRRDVEAHLTWLAGEDLLAEHPPPGFLKPATIILRRKQIHGLVSAAIHAGVPPDALQSLADLVQPAVAKKALNYFLKRYDGEVTVYIQGLAGSVLAISRHWVRADEQTLTELRELRRRLGTDSQRGLTEKNRNTLRQFESPDNVDRLIHLPEALSRSVRRAASPKRRAVQIQLALAIQLLMGAPMRIGNLVALRLDQHIQRPGGRKGGAFIVLAEREVKNGAPQEYVLSAVTVALLDDYLVHYRPHLANNDNPWLFPGPGGKHKCAATLSGQIKDIIFKETGLMVTPHQFRHLAAKLFLDAHPGSYETVRRLLGHQNIKNTVNFYAGMETRAAVAQYDQLLTDLRSRGQARNCRDRR